MSEWKTLTTQVVYENPYMRVHEDQVINPIGKQTIYGYIEPRGESVCVVPIDENGNTYLVRQFRYPLKLAVWECVAGSCDSQSAEDAAKRELLEETGLTAEQITIIGDIYLADNVSSFKNTICLARNLTQVTDQLDEADGILETKKISIADVTEQILSGAIQCGPSIAAFFMVKAYLEGANT